MTAKPTAQAGSGESSPERFNPADAGPTLIASEHYLRYVWAAELVKGKQVLDAGCGIGYGSKILSDAGAARVVAVDIDDVFVNGDDHSVQFYIADIRSMPFADGEFDVVVCFEVIEHIEHRDQAIAELARVLNDRGALVISSPNRNAYPAGNPHHVYEYLPEELEAEVGAHFGWSALYRQDDWLGSTIRHRRSVNASDPTRAKQLPVHEVDQARDDHEPYSIVLASNGELPDASERVMLGSAFEVRWWHDRLAELQSELGSSNTEVERVMAERAQSTARSEHQIAELKSQLASSRALVEQAQADVAAARDRFERELARVRATAENDVARASEDARRSTAALIQIETQRAKELEVLRDTERQIRDLQEAYDQAHRIIEGMQLTRVWRLGGFYWRTRDRLLGRRSA